MEFRSKRDDAVSALKPAPRDVSSELTDEDRDTCHPAGPQETLAAYANR